MCEDVDWKKLLLWKEAIICKPIDYNVSEEIDLKTTLPSQTS